jgi:hypothetical protein
MGAVWNFQQWRGAAPGRGLWGLKHGWWVVICGLYILSPIDAIPDFIPILGQMDDFGILMFMAYNLVQWFRTREAATCPPNTLASGDGVTMHVYEVQITDETGERWVEVAATGPDEARRSVAARGKYKTVGNVRARA